MYRYTLIILFYVMNVRIHWFLKCLPTSLRLGKLCFRYRGTAVNSQSIRSKGLHGDWIIMSCWFLPLFFLCNCSQFLYRYHTIVFICFLYNVIINNRRNSITSANIAFHYIVQKSSALFVAGFLRAKSCHHETNEVHRPWCSLALWHQAHDPKPSEWRVGHHEYAD